jgi:ferredoxin-NADP reductase
MPTASSTASSTARPRPANGRTHLNLRVLAVAPAARETITLSLALPGTQRAPAPYLPGQFITLSLPTAGGSLLRSYSLAGDGDAGRPWEITIKRQPGGIASGHIHRHVRPGMLLTASMPQGHFTLPSRIQPESTLVFVAAGSGITPIYGMLRALARLAPARRPHVQLHYAYRTAEDGIYAREIAALDPDHAWLTQYHYLSASGHRLRAEHVLSSLGADAARGEWYICGPAALQQQVQVAARARGVPEERIHVETFASPARREAAPGRGGKVAGQIHLVDTGAVLDARPRETILETLERNGYASPFECRAGACGTCKLRLLAGQVRNGDGGGLTRGERAAGYILSCGAEPIGNVTLATAGKRTGGGRPIISTVAHRAGRHKLRVALTAGAAAVFLTSLGLASNAIAIHTDGSSSGVSTSGSDGGSSSQYPSGSGSFSTNPAFGSNSSSGVS